MYLQSLFCWKVTFKMLEIGMGASLGGNTLPVSHLALDFKYNQALKLKTIFPGRENESKAKCVEFCLFSPYKFNNITMHWDFPFTVHLFALNIGKWANLVSSWVMEPSGYLGPCLLEMWLNLTESTFFDPWWSRALSWTSSGSCDFCLS